MVDAVVFDFDGVIADTETPEYLAWKTLYARCGWQFPLESWLRNVGRVDSPFDALEPFHLAGSQLTPEAALALWQEYRAGLEGAYLEPLPGVVPLVDALRTQGIPTAVASSSRASRVRGLLAALHLAQKFDAVACGDEVARAKPWPDVYLLAAQRVGARPEACVALEDSENGLRAAKAAGMRCIVIPSALTRTLDFSAADLIVGSLRDVTPEDIAALADRRTLSG